MTEELSGFQIKRDLVRLVPGLEEKVPCPEAGLSPGRRCRPDHTDTVINLVQHLNDNWRWSRERIADWLDTLDTDLSFPKDPVPAEDGSAAGSSSDGHYAFIVHGKTKQGKAYFSSTVAAFDHKFIIDIKGCVVYNLNVEQKIWDVQQKVWNKSHELLTSTFLAPEKTLKPPPLPAWARDLDEHVPTTPALPIYDPWRWRRGEPPLTLEAPEWKPESRGTRVALPPALVIDPSYPTSRPKEKARGH